MASIVNSTRVETLTEDNYDTWRVHVEEFINSVLWGYVCGKLPKPVAGETVFEAKDSKAKSNLILSISPSELKHVRACEISKDVWDKV